MYSKRTRLLCAAFFILGVLVAIVLVSWPEPYFAPLFTIQVSARINTRKSFATDGEESLKSGRTTVRISPCGVIKAIEVPLANPADAVPGPGDHQQQPKCLSVVPAYILHLELNSDSDVQGLVNYWGKGGREKLIAPLLSSLARVPGGGSINISYFLPTFARLRLYTYPESWNDDSVTKQDCVFTSLNFFNERPDTNLFDLAYREKYINEQYFAVKEDPSFGDLVVLLNEQDEVFHACVYIAEGFVFTKNGFNAAQPWVVMKMSDMLHFYDAAAKSRHILFLRLKRFAEPNQAVELRKS
jgi:hypothetical protein